MEFHFKIIRYIKIQIILLVLLFPFTVFSWEGQFSEKAQYVTYKFPDDRLPRHPFTRFPHTGIMISSHCVYTSGKIKKGREYVAKDFYTKKDDVLKDLNNPQKLQKIENINLLS